MASWGSIVGGILAGAGGIGQATEQARQDQLAQAKLDQEKLYRQSQLDLEQQKMNQAEAARMISVPEIQALSSALGVDMTGTSLPPEGKFARDLVAPMLTARAEQAKRAQEQGAIDQARAILAPAMGTPAKTVPPEAAMYGEDVPAVAPQTVSRESVVSGLMGVPHGAELAKVLLPPQTQAKFSLHGSATGPQFKINNMTGEVEQVSQGQPPAKVFSIHGSATGPQFRLDQATGQVEMISPGQPREPVQPNAMTQILGLAAQLSALKEQGQTPQTSAKMRMLTDQLNAAKMVSGAPGGEIYGAGNLIGGGAAPEVPGAAARPGSLVSTPGIPSAAERKDRAQQDTSLKILDDISQAFDPAFVGPGRAKMAKVSGKIPILSGMEILPGTTEKEARFDKLLETFQAVVNPDYAHRFGINEFELMRHIMPNKEQPAPVFKSSLRVATERLKYLLEREAANQQAAGIRPLPGPGVTPAAPGPAVPDADRRVRDKYNAW